MPTYLSHVFVLPIISTLLKNNMLPSVANDMVAFAASIFCLGTGYVFCLCCVQEFSLAGGQDAMNVIFLLRFAGTANLWKNTLFPDIKKPRKCGVFLCPCSGGVICFWALLIVYA
jgi:hypothetical protein